jgi:hypothetical protein
MTELRVIIFFFFLPECNARPASNLLCILRRKRPGNFGRSVRPTAMSTLQNGHHRDRMCPKGAMKGHIDGTKAEGFRKLDSQPTRVCMPPSTGMTAPVM